MAQFIFKMPVQFGRQDIILLTFLQCFESVTSILFMASTSEFDQVSSLKYLWAHFSWMHEHEHKHKVSSSKLSYKFLWAHLNWMHDFLSRIVYVFWRCRSLIWASLTEVEKIMRFFTDSILHKNNFLKLKFSIFLSTSSIIPPLLQCLRMLPRRFQKLSFNDTLGKSKLFTKHV